MLTRCAVLFGLVAVTQGKMDGFIVDGDYASITDFPHSAFLAVHCMAGDEWQGRWICGSSILNQRILLTAGHCLDHCQVDETFIAINLGDETRVEGVTRSSQTFIVHEQYTRYGLYNDIALVRMKTSVTLNWKASRVALLRNPPYNEPAAVAGWGVIDDEDNLSFKLQYVAQIVRNREKCIKRVGSIPPGTLCASNKDKSRHPSRGDSGSALVVRDYIQIGLVSFNILPLKNIIIYTDIGYFYDWIRFNTEKLYCLKKLS